MTERNAEKLKKAPKDTKNLNKGQFIGDYSTPDDIRLELPKKRVSLKRREDIVKLCRGIADQEREYVLVISLKQTQEVSNIRIVSMGSRIGTFFNPSTVFRSAILDESHGIVIVHNHPGGNVNPSKVDKKSLKRLIKIGDLLDIFVLESIIISGKKWQSYMPRGKR
jgi:DNA repair protein RadC